MSGTETYWEGWFVTTDKLRLSEGCDSEEGLTMMHVMILEMCEQNANVNQCSRIKTKTHVDPPAYAETANKVGNKDGKETIYGPVVCDAHMTEVMHSKDELVPEQTEADGTEG